MLHGYMYEAVVGFERLVVYTACSQYRIHVSAGARVISSCSYGPSGVRMGGGFGSSDVRVAHTTIAPG